MACHMPALCGGTAKRVTGRMGKELREMKMHVGYTGRRGNELNMLGQSIVAWVG